MDGQVFAGNGCSGRYADDVELENKKNDAWQVSSAFCHQQAADMAEAGDGSDEIAI